MTDLKNNKYLQQFGSRASFVYIDFETFVEKVLEDGGQLLFLLYLRFSIGRDQI